MELVDIYNNKHEKLNYTKGRKELVEGEFRLSCFVWIINDKEEILIQQRLATAKNCANMWETTSGGALAGDSALEGTLRESDLIAIVLHGGADFVEVFLLESNIDVNELKLQEDEVQAAKWVSISEFEEIIKSGNASDTSFNIFKNYYDNFYKRYLTFENGKPIFKRIGE